MNAPLTGYVSQQPVPLPQNVAVLTPAGANPAERYQSSFIGLGITQLVVGCSGIILAIVALALLGGYGYAGSGIWGGLWYVVSGSLAVASSKNPNSCNVIAGLVISILATLVALAALILDVAAAVYWNFYGIQSLTAIHAILALLSLTEFVTAITHSAYCCKANCGRPLAPATAVVTVPMQVQQQAPPYPTEQAIGVATVPMQVNQPMAPTEQKM